VPGSRADVDADDGAACFRVVRGTGAANDKHNVGIVRVELGCDAVRGQRFSDGVLDDSPQLQRGSFEIGSRADFDREADALASGKPFVGHERRQQIRKERFQASGCARTKVPRDARRRAVIAGGDPRHARIEGVQQRGLSFALRLFEMHIEGRAHDKAFQFRLHHAVCPG
jgi:hypothetical protein